MIKKLFILFFTLPVALFGYIDEPYHDTAFMGPPKTLYSLFYGSYYRTDHFWNKHGKKLPTFNHFEKQDYRLDLEYAINKRHSVFLKGGYSLVNEEINRNSRGFEDVEASWQANIFTKHLSALSAKTTLIIPSGNTKSCIRYGKFGGELKLLYSKVFYIFNKQFWTDFTLGYRMYSGFPSDQIVSSASFGVTLKPYLWLISSTNLNYGVFNGKTSANFNNIVFNPNFRLLTTQLQGIVQLHKHVSITLGGFIHLWGENVGQGGGGYGGVWFIY